MLKKEPTYITEKEIFPKRLRELVEETNTTQEKLGEALGVRRQTISLYITGQSKPDWTQVAKIATFFNVPSDYLLGLSDNRFNENLDFGRELGLSDYATSRIKWIAANSPKFGWNPLDFLLNHKFISELFSLSWCSRYYQEDKEKGLYEIGINQDLDINQEALEMALEKENRHIRVINSRELVEMKMYKVFNRFNSMLEKFKYGIKLPDIKKVNDDATENNT